MSNGSAPVCPISRDQAVPAQAGLILPVIMPEAVDLPSLIAAVNAIGHNINFLL